VGALRFVLRGGCALRVSLAGFEATVLGRSL
jgi:hypothetical protein